MVTAVDTSAGRLIDASGGGDGPRVALTWCVGVVSLLWWQVHGGDVAVVQGHSGGLVDRAVGLLWWLGVDSRDDGAVDSLGWWASTLSWWWAVDRGWGQTGGLWWHAWVVGNWLNGHWRGWVGSWHRWVQSVAGRAGRDGARDVGGRSQPGRIVGVGVGGGDWSRAWHEGSNGLADGGGVDAGDHLRGGAWIVGCGGRGRVGLVVAAALAGGDGDCGGCQRSLNATRGRDSHWARGNCGVCRLSLSAGVASWVRVGRGRLAAGRGVSTRGVRVPGVAARA